MITDNNGNEISVEEFVNRVNADNILSFLFPVIGKLEFEKHQEAIDIISSYLTRHTQPKEIKENL